MKKNRIPLLVCVLSTALFTSCSGKSETATESEKENSERIAEEETLYSRIAARRAIDTALIPYRHECPIDLGNGTKLTDLTRDDDYLIYNIEVGPSINVSNFQLDDKAKKEVVRLLGTNANMAIKAHLGVRYIYTNSKTKKETEFVVTPAEVTEILQENGY